MKHRSHSFLMLLLILSLTIGMLSGCGTPKYTVTFDPNGGKVLAGELIQTVEEGGNAVFPELKNGDKVLYWEGDPTNVKSDITITAGWKDWYKVSFDLNGGELVSGETEQRILEGEDAVPPEVVRDKYELTWKGDWKKVSSDVTVKAEWSKIAMNTEDLAEYVQSRTVTVNVTTVDNAQATGSGFFIDGNGTLLTNFHVVEGAKSITVETGDGASYPVQEIVDFSHLYDIAVLKLDMSDSPYLEICDEPVRTGSQVYAVGSALGTLKGSFTAGIVSSTNRKYSMIDCLQMDTPISSGNSGGPLVNIYGEVVGINTASYTSGDSLNLAIKMSNLDKLSMDKHWSMKEFKEWYEREISISWGPVYENYYYDSLVHTYQEVTGSKCLGYAMDGDSQWKKGYKVGYDFYRFEYNTSEYDTYTAYLKENGFEYQNSEKFEAGTSYYYYNEKDSVLLDLFVLNDNSELWIWPKLA